jgi:hypothetical protein
MSSDLRRLNFSPLSYFPKREEIEDEGEDDNAKAPLITVFPTGGRQLSFRNYAATGQESHRRQLGEVASTHEHPLRAFSLALAVLSVNDLKPQLLSNRVLSRFSAAPSDPWKMMSNCELG